MNEYNIIHSLLYTNSLKNQGYLKNIYPIKFNSFTLFRHILNYPIRRGSRMIFSILSIYSDYKISNLINQNSEYLESIISIDSDRVTMNRRDFKSRGEGLENILLGGKWRLFSNPSPVQFLVNSHPNIIHPSPNEMDYRECIKLYGHNPLYRG
jgi:hypothetical protein